jgi:hypothetical protein
MAKKDRQPAEPTAEPRKRRTRTPGAVLVSIPTVELTEEEADALAMAGGTIAELFEDRRRKAASAAREYLRAIVRKAVEAVLPDAVHNLRADRREVAISAARAKAEAAAAELRALEGVQGGNAAPVDAAEVQG